MVWFKAAVVAIALLFLPLCLYAQTVAVSIGQAAVTSDSLGGHAPQILSARVAILPGIVVEAEWSSQSRFFEQIDSGPSRVLMLNNQFGEYGRSIRTGEEFRESVAVNVLGRRRAGRVSMLGGAGVVQVRTQTRQTSRWAGCTGPWVPHCFSGNYDVTANDERTVPQFVGGVDFGVNSWLQLYGSGQIIAGRNAFEPSLVGGARLVLPRELPAQARVWVTLADGTERRGTLIEATDDRLTLRAADREDRLSRSQVRFVETTDSLVDGVLYGIAVATAAAWATGVLDADRGVPAFMVAGVGIGGLIDSLVSGRRVLRLWP